MYRKESEIYVFFLLYLLEVLDNHQLNYLFELN